MATTREIRKAVLAYSGGLDTSVTIRWLTEHGYEVHAVAVDVGQREDFDEIVERGARAGAAGVRVVDAGRPVRGRVPDARDQGQRPLRGEVPDGLRPRPAVHRRGGREGRARDRGARRGPRLHRQGERPGALRGVVRRAGARPRGARPDPRRQHPAREGDRLAGEWGIPIASVVTTYSVDENVWGRTAECGPLEDPWVAPPDDAFERTAPPEARPTEPAEITTFERGVPVALDGETVTLPDLIRRLDVLGGSYGFGRVDMIENRRVGIKSRELYEVPGALAIIHAHQALEDLTLERDVAHHKPQLEQRWADLVYDGQWFSPLRVAIDAYVDATQPRVTGDVRLRFESGSCTAVGRRSEHSLYDLSLATYGSGDAFDQSDAEGYVRLYGLPLKVWSARQGTGS